jgi:hypothetical protein
MDYVEKLDRMVGAILRFSSRTSLEDTIWGASDWEWCEDINYSNE